MSRRGRVRRGIALAATLVVALATLASAAGATTARAEAAAPSAESGPAPGTLDYWKRELGNIWFAFGKLREQGSTPGFRAAVDAERSRLQAFWREEDRTEFRGRPRFTFAVTGLEGFLGDPWRNETLWDGTHERIYILNRWGAKLAMDLWGPADLFDSDRPRPTVVITTGSIQGNARMYFWAAQTLATAGYVVLTYDVQGQGESETFGHKPGGGIWCGDVDQPPDTPAFLREISPCPGFPSQQLANFGVGAIDAHNFALSTPDAPYEHFRPGTGTEEHNPWHAYVDQDRIGAAGHSFGAAAVSFVQAHPELLRHPVRAVAAWDSLSTCSGQIPGRPCPAEAVNAPLAPALNLTNDYFLGFIPIADPPDPDAALDAFDHWRAADREVVSIAFRGGTHLEYTSVPFNVLGATENGNDLAAYYTLAFFDYFLRDDPSGKDRLLAREIDFTHYDPLGVPEPKRWVVDFFTSFYNDSAVFLDGTCVSDWKQNTESC